jgi:hypothetical protein
MTELLQQLSTSTTCHSTLATSPVSIGMKIFRPLSLEKDTAMIYQEQYQQNLLSPIGEIVDVNYQHNLGMAMITLETLFHAEGNFVAVYLPPVNNDSTSETIASTTTEISM